MSKKKLRVNVANFILHREACGECGECYIEQLWRDIGDYGMCHCSKTKQAFSDALKKMLPPTKGGLPPKDTLIIAKLKTGEHVCVKLFYDNENKPCMYYDDFDNWYPISNVTFVDFVRPQYIDIEVED